MNTKVSLRHSRNPRPQTLKSNFKSQCHDLQLCELGQVTYSYPSIGTHNIIHFRDMGWIYGGVNIKLPKGTKVTQKIYVDCAKANWTPGEKPWVNVLCLHGCPDGSPIPAASTLSRVNQGRQSQFHVSPSWSRSGRTSRREGVQLRRGFGFVSVPARRRVSLPALDSLPISHEITGFSLLPEGPPRLHTKAAEGTWGLRE